MSKTSKLSIARLSCFHWLKLKLKARNVWNAPRINDCERKCFNYKQGRRSSTQVEYLIKENLKMFRLEQFDHSMMVMEMMIAYVKRYPDDDDDVDDDHDDIGAIVGRSLQESAVDDVGDKGRGVHKILLIIALWKFLWSTTPLSWLQHPSSHTSKKTVLQVNSLSCNSRLSLWASKNILDNYTVAGYSRAEHSSRVLEPSARADYEYECRAELEPSCTRLAQAVT